MLLVKTRCLYYPQRNVTADSLAGVLGMLMFLVANVASSRDEEQTTEAA